MCFIINYMFSFLRRSRVVTRFAPSPTGELHVGGARTALFSYIFAKQHNGKFLLRIEDTDRERYIDGSDKRIIESLEWLGLIPDNRKNILVQSARVSIYKKYALELVEKGSAYFCVCSKEQLEQDRQEQISQKKPPKYSGRCRSLNLQLEDLKNRPHVIRMKMPSAGSLTFSDEVRGQVTFDLSLLDDQVLIKSDGYPTYHLASVVDDHETGITHVIRAEEWLPSTPKHILLYQMFGWQAPIFAHLPIILAPDRSKLSKRHGAIGVLEYRKNGYLAEAMVNFITLLGWHSKEEKEILSLEQIIKEFDLKRVQKAGAIFDIQKLNWLNAEYLKSKSAEELLKQLTNLYGQEKIGNPEFALKILKIGKERSTTLADFETLKTSFELSNYNSDLLIWKNIPPEEILENLRKSREIIRGIFLDEFNKENLEKYLMPYANSTGRGETLWPLRVALSGKDKSPGPFEIMEVIGKEETLRRIEMAIEKLANSN